MCLCAGNNAFVCVGTFTRKDKKVSEPPVEYAPLGSASAAADGGKGKGKAAAPADDSGKGKTGSLPAAAPPRYCRLSQYLPSGQNCTWQQSSPFPGTSAGMLRHLTSSDTQRGWLWLPLLVIEDPPHASSLDSSGMVT